MSLANFFVAVSPAAKLSQLVHFLNAHSDRKVMVYALTCALVDYLHLVLTRLQLLGDIPLLALHGKMVQKKRTGVYSKFIAVRAAVPIPYPYRATMLSPPNDYNRIVPIPTHVNVAGLVRRVAVHGRSCSRAGHS